MSEALKIKKNKKEKVFVKQTAMTELDAVCIADNSIGYLRLFE